MGFCQCALRSMPSRKGIGPQQNAVNALLPLSLTLLTDVAAIARPSRLNAANDRSEHVAIGHCGLDESQYPARQEPRPTQ